MHWTQRRRLHKSSVPLSMSSDVNHCLADYATVATIYSVSLRLDCHMLKTATQTAIYRLRTVTDIDSNSDYELPVTQIVTKTVTLNRQIIKIW
ncbi:hypothetical protein Bpfe_018595 [Biomphalaria pfeifferi]|uniref:Uncharacterized protein n=1 Tax=Biomphalaria pfeifferi TaxID=112525 RepID=A0AAD8BCI4_BIOPF|nr:hypothetical protein Bpfe_018595 [Biomphalaria pfeifferi]